MNKYVFMIILGGIGSHSAQLLQFGPLTRIMKQQGLEEYVPVVMSAFWLGCGLTSFLVGMLLDRGKLRTVLIWSLPIAVCPFGYMSTDYRVLLATRFLHGVLIAFLSISLVYKLRLMLPPMKKSGEQANRPHSFRDILLAWKEKWQQLKAKGWKEVIRAGDPHKMGMALNATLIALISTLVFSFLGYKWVDQGWPLIGWASITSLLFLLSIGFALMTHKEERSRSKQTLLEEEKSVKRTLTKTEKKQHRVDLLLAFIPGLGMGVIGTVHATYLPLYTTLTIVPLIMFVKRMSEVVGAWLVAFFPSKWDRQMMLGGIVVTGAGVVVLWISPNSTFLFISAVLLGLGFETHRSTLSNSIYQKEKKKGTAVVIPNVAFNFACFIGSLWGALAGLVGYRYLWMTLLVWFAFPLSALLFENRRKG
jgi:MFS family permease